MHISRIINATVLLGLAALLGGCAYPGQFGLGAEARIERQLAAMSLEDKVGQLFMICFEGPSLDKGLDRLMTRIHPGGIILFSGTGNVQNPAQVAALTASAQALALRTGAKIPLFVSVDQEGGPVARLRQGFTRFPSAMAVAATGDPALARRLAEAQGLELAAVGINMNLAPVADVNSNPVNPVIGVRSFSADPGQAARFVAASVHGYAAAGVLSCAKHFPGHGDTSTDSHLDLPFVGRTAPELQTSEFPPFDAAIQAGVPAVMTAHIVVPALEPEPGLPGTLSPRILGLLRAKGFEGLILTDSLGMNALAQAASVPSASVLSFLAGADILVFGPDARYDGQNPVYAYDRLLALARSGAISETRLNDSVRRILRFKSAYRITGSPGTLGLAGALATASTPEHQALAQEIAARAVTLVRDPNRLLPLKPGGKTLVVFPAGREDIATELSRSMAAVRPLSIALEPTPEERTRVLEAAAGADVVVFCAYDAFRRPEQAGLIADLPPERTVLVSLGLPTDGDRLPGAASVGLFSDVPASLRAGAVFLTGQAKPPAGPRCPKPGRAVDKFGDMSYKDWLLLKPQEIFRSHTKASACNPG